MKFGRRLRDYIAQQGSQSEAGWFVDYGLLKHHIRLLREALPRPTPAAQRRPSLASVASVPSATSTPGLTVTQFLYPPSESATEAEAEESNDLNTDEDHSEDYEAAGQTVTPLTPGTASSEIDEQARLSALIGEVPIRRRHNSANNSNVTDAPAEPQKRRQKPLSNLSFARVLHDELKRVNQAFVKSEAECDRLLENIKRLRRLNKGGWPKQETVQLAMLAHHLIAAIQWNTTAVVKIVKKARRHLSSEVCPVKAQEVLDRQHFYLTMTPASVLAQMPRSLLDSLFSGVPSKNTAQVTDSLEQTGLEASPTAEEKKAVDYRAILAPLVGSSHTEEPQLDENIEFYAKQLEMDCPVCLESSNSPVMCVCGHSFCLSCIKLTDKCPVCRKGHGFRFARHGTGDVLRLTPSKKTVTIATAVFRAVRDLVWYLMLLAMVLPFLAAFFTVGCFWMVAQGTVNLLWGRKVDFSPPLRYERWPRIAPHGISTTPPPWSFPAVWEADVAEESTSSTSPTAPTLAPESRSR